MYGFDDLGCMVCAWVTHAGDAFDVRWRLRRTIALFAPIDGLSRPLSLSTAWSSVLWLTFGALFGIDWSRRCKHNRTCKRRQFVNSNWCVNYRWCHHEMITASHPLDIECTMQCIYISCCTLNAMPPGHRKDLTRAWLYYINETVFQWNSHRKKIDTFGRIQRMLNHP